jgi:hypothetical protein
VSALRLLYRVVGIVYVVLVHRHVGCIGVERVS